MTADAEDAEPRVLVRASGGVGHLTLNRPRAINALDVGMVRDLAAALDAWDGAGDIDIVVLDGAGDRGFCAGGDVRGLYAQIADGRAEDAGVFFREEYALNARIAEYSVPVVAIADGITMGGGIGLAGHAAVRIVTERSVLAMPESRIGFTPDVGGTRLLARAPGRLGEYLALTGASMDAADAIYAGFADHFVPSGRLDALRDQLRSLSDPLRSRSDQPRSLSLSKGETPGAAGLAAARRWIDDAFSADTVGEIVERLRARPEPEASTTADTLETLSPTALVVALEAVRRARELPDLRSVLTQEYALVMWFATSQPDLVEGIRAQLVDKDRSPRWSPASLAELAPGVVESAFSYRPATGLWG